MKIKPASFAKKSGAKDETTKLSRKLKFLFGLNNRKTTRGMQKKPVIYTGHLNNDRLLVQSTVYVHNKSGKAAKNLAYIGREAIESYRREHEESIVNNHDITKWEDDRYHYMLIISQPRENALRLDEFTKEFVAEMQDDLGTKLDWVAAVHRNTDNPHVHLMVRGKDENGNDLEIRTQYLHRVAPQIATEIAAIRLSEDMQFIKTRKRGLVNEHKAIHRHSSRRGRKISR